MDISTRSIDFSQVINNASTGYIISSIEEDIVYANTYIYQLLGYQRNEKLDWRTIVHPDSFHSYSEHLNMVYQYNRSIENIELKLVSNNDSIVFSKATMTPLEMNGLRCTQVQLVESQTQPSIYRVIEQPDKVVGETITEIILQVNLDGKIEYVYPSNREVCGYDPNELIGVNIKKGIHKDDRVKFESVLKDVLVLKKPLICRYRANNKSGQFEWVESRIKLLKKGNNQRIIIGTRNITEQMEAENLLKQSEKLAVIGELSAGVVHEIKNPLTSIKGFLQLMQAGAIKTDDYITILNSEIERIEKIANDLLSFAKPSEEMNKQNINQIIDEVVFLIEMQARKKNIRILWERPVEEIVILGNSSQLKQVFINLIKNAVEASPENSKIVVTVTKHGEVVNIHVEDYGCGIPNDKLNKIGDSFFTTKEKGTGLGLMVTHKIINNHQGKITVESEEGNGTIFTVSLPLLETST